MSKSNIWWLVSVLGMMCILAACWWTVWKEIDKQYPWQEWKQIESTKKDVKIYKGKWHKTYLEVIK